LGLYVALMPAVQAQAPDPVAAGVYDEAAALLDRLRREESLVGAGVSVLWPGLSPWHYALGLAAREGSSAFTIETPSAQRELTQLFTAVAVLQLVEAGRVDLDAPFNNYFPEFQPYTGGLPAAFTIRQLLSHHSGLPAYYAPGSGLQAFRATGADDAWREVLARSAELTLVAAPGQVYEYSYLDYVLLGLLIEQQSGESYSGYIEQHILAPLALRDTYFSADLDTVPGIARVYREQEQRPHERLRDIPAVGLASSVRDLGTLLQALLQTLLQGGQGVLKPESVAQLFQAQSVSPYDDELGFGLGVFVSRVSGDLEAVSLAAVNGSAHSYLVAIPRYGLGVVLSTNTELNSMKLRAAADRLLARMIEVWSGDAVPPYAPHSNVELTEQKAASLRGAFSGPGGVYRVQQRRGSLRAEVPFLPFLVSVNLVPREADYYGVELRVLGLNVGRLSQLEEIATGLEGKLTTVEGRRLWYWYLQGVAVATLTELTPAPKGAALTAWRERVGVYEAEAANAAYVLAFDADSGNLTFGQQARASRRGRQPPELQCVVDAQLLRSCNLGLLGSGNRSALRALADGRLVDAFGVYYHRR
jgi:CubicO group peptidase (beta-lactamase class C family)